MSALRIVFSQALPAFRPGETIEGTVEWDLPEPDDDLDLFLYLFWTTDGKGAEEDPEEIASDRFHVEGQKGSHAFKFEVPESPWSFEGSLFSVKWYLELSGYDDDLRADIVVSPTGQPIRASAPA